MAEVKGRDMTKLHYGSFEAILREYIVPPISQFDFGCILLTSPYVDARDVNKDDLRADSHLNDTFISKLCSGKRSLTEKRFSQHCGATALEYIKLCFSIEITPHIRENSEGILLREILDLIQADDGLPQEDKAHFIALSQEEALCDFLAEVYQYAVNPKLSSRLRQKSLCVHEKVESPKIEFPPVEEIFPTAKDIILAPGEIFQLKVAVIPKESVNAPLNYVSLDKNIVSVSKTGMLLAHNKRKRGFRRSLSAILNSRGSTDIVVHAESGVSASKTVTVDYRMEKYAEPINFDINNFVPNYAIRMYVRLLGDTEWKDDIDAQVGDKVEYRIEYVNITNDRQENVMIKDSLPTNMKLVSGTTVVYNVNYKKGFTLDNDDIIDAGINLGNYAGKSNAVVTFTAEVVDKNLQLGSNTLVNWVQAGVNGVGLQDFAMVMIFKMPNDI